ncbi:MAG: hypothetical protein LBT50_04250, partial [Prevotellaceae bacterium]|nr:hypothetical protein [Prevotellaceae bacterium]
MKRIIFIICCLCTIGVSAQEKKKIVISSTPDTTISKQIVSLFIGELEIGLQNSGKYEVVGNRKEFAAVLDEELEFQDYVDDREQIEAGKAAGAEIACYAAISKIGKQFNIVCKFRALKTTESMKQGDAIGQPFSVSAENEDDLIDAAHRMARKITSVRDVTAEKKIGYVKAPKCYYDESTGGYVDCDITVSDEENLTYTEACEFCKNKGEDWRLPTKEELSMIYRNRFDIEKAGGVRFKAK